MPWIISRQKKFKSYKIANLHLLTFAFKSSIYSEWLFAPPQSILDRNAIHLFHPSEEILFFTWITTFLVWFVHQSVCKKMKRTINQQLQKILNRDHWEWFANSNTNVKTISRCKIIVNWYLHPTVSSRSLRGLERKERFTGNKTLKKTIISLFAVFLPFDFDKFCCKHSLNPSWYVQYRPADQTHTRSWPIRKK